MRARNVITLKIQPGSKMAQGRLPVDQTVDEQGNIRASFDAVSWSALMASIGEYTPMVKESQSWIMEKLGITSPSS
jgi:hypothetical protein